MIALDSGTRQLLSDVWQAYGASSAVSLSALTHNRDLPEGYPWHVTWYDKEGKDRWGTDISDEDIEKSFQNLLVPA